MEKQVTVGLVQAQWDPSPHAHRGSLLDGIKAAAEQHACIVFLPELSLLRYFGDKERGDPQVLALAELLDNGPTANLCREGSTANKVFVVGSLFEKYEENGSINYFNTAVIYNPEGNLHGFTRKQHIPSGAGYNETFFFSSGNSDYPVHDLGFLKLAIPTCYDQWFPEVARIYALKGADLIMYPTAIGSEPNFPGYDTQPMWQTMMVSHAIANGVFVGAINRVGFEGVITFYGNSFICSPSGKIIQQATRDKPQVVVAQLSFADLTFWRNLFPLLKQRNPQSYHALVE